jgi:hypothetical protein
MGQEVDVAPVQLIFVVGVNTCGMQATRRRRQVGVSGYVRLADRNVTQAVIQMGVRIILVSRAGAHFLTALHCFPRRSLQRIVANKATLFQLQ